MNDTTPATTIRVVCSCGTPLRIRTEQIGKRVKCPACGAGVSTTAASLPSSEPLPPRTGLEGLVPDYRIRPDHWLQVAWPHCRAVLGPSIGYLFLFSPIAAVLLLFLWSPLVLLLSGDSPETSLVLVLVPFGLAANVIVLPALAMGFHVVCQAQLKGKPWRFATFFSGFRWTWPLAGRAALLLGAEVVLLLPGIAVLAVSRHIWTEPPAAAVGIRAGLLLAYFLFGGYLLLRLVFFSHLLIIDRGCGPIQALRGSWLLSRGHGWGLCGLLLLVLLLPLLGLGALLVLPVVVLVLNAGYLLVAGSESLPDQQHEAEKRGSPVSRRAWLPAAAVAAVVLLFGTWMGWRAHAAQAFREELRAYRRQQDETRRVGAARAEPYRRALASQEAEELVGFFRAGGCWSTELFRREPVEAEGGPGPGIPGGMPPGPGPPGQMGQREPPQRFLVLGPRGLRQARSAAPGPGWAATIRRLEELRARPEERQLFHNRFADALSRGEVEAVLVEVAREPSRDPPGGAGAGGPGTPAMPGAPGMGDPMAAARGFQDTPVPLDRAVPLSRDRFLKLVEDRIE